MNRKKSIIIVILVVVGVGIMATDFNLSGKEVEVRTNKADKVNSQIQKISPKKIEKKDNIKASPYILSEKSVQSITKINLIMIFVLKFMCLVFGFWTIYLGYDLLKRGVKGEFKFSAEMSGFKSGLASASPGLLFLLLGIILISFALYVKKDIPIQFSQQKGDQNIDVQNAPIPSEDDY